MNAPVDPPAPGLRVLVIHGESIFCAGAQKMLAYFAEGALEAGLDPLFALAPNDKLAPLLPPRARVVALPDNQRFSLAGGWRQILAVRRAVREFAPVALHGWTARDWELTAAAGRLTRRPALGLLHDHPRANHISRSRQCLMRGCATFGLDRVLCVSEAVADACRGAGYPAHRLVVVRNGIPHGPIPPAPPASSSRPIQLGYLGLFSERKGLRTLFQLIDELHRVRPDGWEVALAGGAQDDTGRRLVEELRATYEARPWWPRIRWVGWVTRPADFLRTLDLLVVPSSEFDPFPTVLLEAGSAARPVFATRVGGVAEIVEDGLTGWLFDAAAPGPGAARLAPLLGEPRELARAGRAAAERVRTEFSVHRMASAYRDAYRSLLRPGRR